MTDVITRPATWVEQRMWLDGHGDLPFTYTETEHGLEVTVPDAIPTTGARRGEIDMDTVVALLRTRHGIESAEVHMTGGGCATIYAGPAEQVDDGTGYDPFWQQPIGAGPGTYMGRRGFSETSLHEFTVGVDSYVYGSDDTPYTDFADAGCATHSQVAALIALYVGVWAQTRSVPGTDDVEAIGLDGTLRSRPKWLTDDEAEIAAHVAEQNRLNHIRREQAAAARSYVPEGY